MTNRERLIVRVAFRLKDQKADSTNVAEVLDGMNLADFPWNWKRFVRDVQRYQKETR